MSWGSDLGGYLSYDYLAPVGAEAQLGALWQLLQAQHAQQLQQYGPAPEPAERRAERWAVWAVRQWKPGTLPTLPAPLPRWWPK